MPETTIRKRKKYKEINEGRDFRRHTKDELRRIDFKESDLQGANFEGCQHLQCIDFSGANLCGANFSKANIYGINFSGANLSGADFRAAKNHEDYEEGGNNNPSLISFKDANICGANFENANLSGADFTLAKTDYPKWWNLSIKALMLFLSVLSALVLFHSIDIVQVFLFDSAEFDANLKDIVSQMTEVVIEDESPNAWSPEILKAVDSIEDNENGFHVRTDDAIKLSESIHNKCINDGNDEFNAKFAWENSSGACEAADKFSELVTPDPIGPKPIFLLTLLSVAAICAISFLSINANLLGIVIVLINVSIAFAAIAEATLSISIFHGLIALFGIISGVLAQAISTAFGNAAEIDKISSREYKLTKVLRWIVCILAMLIFAGNTIKPANDLGSRIWIPLILSVIILVIGNCIGSEAIGGNKEFIFGSRNDNSEEASLRFERYFVLEFLTVKLLRLGPVTNFWKAQLEGASFEKADLKKYSTLIGGKDYDDNTLASILGLVGGRDYDSKTLASVLKPGKEEERKRLYDEVVRRSSVLSSSFWYGSLILNVANDRVQEIFVLGNIDNDGIINFGEVVGNLVSQLSNSPLKEDVDFKIDKNLNDLNLNDLLHVVKSTKNLPNSEKYKILKYFEKIAESLQ